MKLFTIFLALLLLPHYALAGLAPIAVPNGTTLRFLGSGLKADGTAHIDVNGKLTTQPYVQLNGSASGNVQLQVGATPTVHTITFPDTVCATSEYWADDGTGKMICTPAATGSLTAVIGAAPINSSGGDEPVISIAPATDVDDGYLTHTDHVLFKSKAAGRVSNTISATFTLPTLTSDYILNVDTTSAAVAVTMADATASNNFCAKIKNIGSHAVTLTPTGSQKIDNQSNDVLSDVNKAHELCAVNGNWFIY